MFHLSFSPQLSQAQPTLAVSGDALTFDGSVLDLSGLPEGATLPCAAIACDWLASDVERRNGVIHLTLILPITADAPRAARFPQPITVTGDGPIALPGSPSPEDAA